MPLYDFYCSRCGVTEEIISSITEKVTHTCGTEMVRKFSLPGIITKSSGKTMAADMLNSKQAQHMHPWTKAEAAKGLESSPRTVF